MKQLKILVTRPRGQADALCEAIEGAGGIALRQATIIIEAADDQKALLSNISHLNQIDIAIFVSANAVVHASPHIKQHAWPLSSKLRIVAIGKATRQALESHDIPVHACAQNHPSSEGLLELPELQHVNNKTIMLFRGQGGRVLLNNSLQARGARVEHAICYKRVKPEPLKAESIQALKNVGLDIIIATSNEGLSNLLELVDAKTRSWLQQKPLLVISQRMVQHGKTLGFTQSPILSSGVGTEDILATLARWQKNKNKESDDGQARKRSTENRNND